MEKMLVFYNKFLSYWRGGRNEFGKRRRTLTDGVQGGENEFGTRPRTRTHGVK